MSLNHKKIIGKLQQIQKILEMETDKIISASENKFQLEITKSVIDYTSNLMKDKISTIFESEIEKFKYIKVIIDYSLVTEPEQLDILLNIIDETKREIADNQVNNIIQNNDDFIKRIIIDFPIDIGVNKIDYFNQTILEKLQESRIGE